MNTSLESMEDELSRLRAKVAELTQERDSADAFTKKIADVCEKAEAQVIALRADKARAEAVIEEAESALKGAVAYQQLSEHYWALNETQEALAAITEYREGK